MRAAVVDDRGIQGEYVHFLKAHRERLPTLDLNVYTNWRELSAQLGTQSPDLVVLDMRFDDGPVDRLAGDLDALTRSARFGGDVQRAEAQLRGLQGVFLLQSLRDEAHYAGPIILFGTLPKAQSDRLLLRYAPLRILDGLLFEGVREALVWAEHTVDGVARHPAPELHPSMPIHPRLQDPHDPQDPQARSRGISLLVDHLPIMALLIDADGAVLQSNDALNRFFGAPPPHLNQILMSPVEDLAQMKAALQGQGSAEFLRDVTRFNDQIRRVHLQAIAVDARSTLLTLRDITEQHLLEVDHRRCRAAVQCCQDLVVIVDHGGGIVYVNPSGEVILGYKPAEMIGLALFDFVHPLDLALTWQMLQETIEKGQRTHGHIRLMTRQRDVRHLRCLSLALASASNNEILLIGRDSTDQHNLQQALIESQKMEGMGRLARGIAHDFNNLLQLVLGSVQCLENEPDLPDSTREWHETIRTAAERGHKVVEQLQAFSRRDVGVRLPCTIKDMLESLTKLVRPMLSAEIHFHLDIQEPTSVVEVDVGQIQQVLLNLVINAREAISGEGTIDISSAETTRQSKPWALITVRDNGHGIPEEHLSRVFEPFFSTKDHRRGTGLGLAVAYGLIESHGGRIEVESNPGQWTLFRVLLPLAPEGTRALCIDGEQAKVFGNDELILIVDDEPMQRLILKRQLEFLGYDVLLAEDGEHALDLFSDYADEIGCVLLDVVMPRRDGLDTLRAMKTLKHDVAIIVTSGLGRDERVTQMLAEGARRFLPKPFRVERLSAVLREVLDTPPLP